MNPDLGVYLSPDPEHRASVTAPGPQAYAYASGRPLVLVDPSGRRFITSGLHPACIGSLKANPIIGSRVRAMEDTPDVVFDIAEIPPTPGLVARGGGQTVEVGDYSPGDCEDSFREIRINISVFVAQNHFAGYPWHYSGVFADDQDVLLAHELGHAEYIWKNGANASQGTASDSTALLFENAMRGIYGLPYRAVH